MEKKKLKKLVLKKEEIVNLNDNEMKNIMGGNSSNPCWAISGYITGKIVDAVTDYFSVPGYECDDDDEDYDQTSDVIMYGGCLLPEVVVIA